MLAGNLDQVFTGDDQHDDAPEIVDWKLDFEREEKKLLARKRREEHLIQRQQAKQEHRKAEAASKEAARPKLKPGETLYAFNQRINNLSRLEQAAKVNSEKNRRKRVKLIEKREEKHKKKARTEIEQDDDFYVLPSEDEAGNSEEERNRTRLHTYRDIPDRPPENIPTLNEKQRFYSLTANPVQGDSKAQMSAIRNRVDELYQKAN